MLALIPTVRGLRSGALLVLFLSVAGCLNPPSNEAVDPLVASGIPDHRAFAGTPCVDCHEVDRPPPGIQAVTGTRTIHGGGRDCGGCHVAGGANWRAFVSFSHSPLPASCIDCHRDAQPVVLINQMQHNYPGVGDCVACHSATAGTSWSGATFQHQPIPATCVECHAAERPTTIVSGFSHAAGGMGDCAACHRNVGTTWAGGFFSHDPVPPNCSDCHAGIRPLGPVGTPPFDHAVAGTGDCRFCHAVFSASKTDWSGGSFSHDPAPSTCIGCHLGVRPVGPAGSPPYDHANGGTGDCVSCHQPRSAVKTDWSGGSFSHSPAPASCAGCHTPDRPATPVGTPAFDHAIAGMGDCKSCHAPRSAMQTDWSGGTFNHQPLPTTCIGCHLAQRPVTVTANGFNHAVNGTGDCVSCHVDAGISWAAVGGSFDHSTLNVATRCDSCHAAERPAVPIAVPWPGHPTNPNQFVHAVVVATDCRTCHLDAGGAWAPGLYSHSPNPGQCSVCHSNQRPIGLAGTPPFNHALGGAGDCVACHAVRSPTKTDWTGGNFVHTNAIPSCAGCHEYQRPTGLVGNPPFNHAIAGTGDCKSCHAIRSATQTDWSGGSFSHLPKPSSCASCHSGIKPSNAVRGTSVSTDNRTYTNDYLHTLVAGDCVSCHQPLSATRTDWSGGNYLHSPVPSTCTTCHNITKPAAGTVSFDHTQPGLADCDSCHVYAGQRWTGATALPTRVTLTPPTGKTWGNYVAPHPAIDAAKSGLTCATCHGSNTGAQIIGYDHALPINGVKCVYCHYTGQTVTSFAVRTRTHNSTGPNKDCTASGCHRPSYPTWNASTRKFSGGGWDEP